MCRFSYLKIFLFILSFNNVLSALSIRKLILSEAYVHNTTSQDETITVVFHEKCPSCPRLHDTHTRSFTIPAGEKQLIQEAPHIIQTIEPRNQALALNFNQTTFTLEAEKKDDIPVTIDFEEALKKDKEYEMLTSGHEEYLKSMPDGVTHQTFFERLKTNYHQYKLTQQKTIARTDTPKIPRTIHTIWFEGKNKGYPLYKQFKQWHQEWRGKHPGWNLIVWNEALIQDKFPEGLFNQKMFNEARMMSDYASMSKIARYEILHKCGGLYIDPDMKCYESFENFHHAYDFYAGLGTLKSFGAINNTIIGAKANHPILKRSMELIKQCDSKLPSDNLDLYNWTARNLSTKSLTQAVYEKLSKESTTDIIFPRSFFDGNNVGKEFYHTQQIVEAAYQHIKHQPEAFCSRGVYSYVSSIPNKSASQ